MPEDNSFESHVSPAEGAAPAEEAVPPEVVAHAADEEEGPENPTTPWCVIN
jgi:hypothetical protein